MGATVEDAKGLDSGAQPGPDEPEPRPGNTKPPGRATRHRVRSGPRRHLGLRARVTITFALGALVLAGAIASITYLSVRSSLLNQEESTLARAAIANATALSGDISEPFVNVQAALASLNASPGSESLVWKSATWYPSSLAVQPSILPDALRSGVLAGHLEEQIISIAGQPELIVGVPIAAAKAAYFQIFSLAEEARTLQTLLGALVVAGAVTVAGAAVLGRWGASRALKPLHETAGAALSIAGGELGTRLRSDDYADLAVLTSAFNRMADGLQERIEREATFTSDVNHELRSPLTTLATSLSVLEARRAELPERSQQALDLLGAEVRRFRRLVDDLLEISKLDAGLGEVNAEEVALGPLVENTVRSSGHSVIVEIPEGVGERRVVIDKRRFERIVANLIENADRYAGGVTRVAAEADGRWGRVAVEDRGPGIAPEERALIFNRFSRGSNARRRGKGAGTGLGLAIVAQHAALLGGHVWVEPNGARGSRFVVELPLLPHSTEDTEL